MVIPCCEVAVGHCLALVLSLATGVGKFLFILFGLLDRLANFLFDLEAGAGEMGAGVGDDSVEVIRRRFRDAKGGSGEGGDFFAVYDHVDDEVAVVHL